jgi:hypothetical protein
MIRDLDTNKDYVMDIQFTPESFRETITRVSFPTNFNQNGFVSFWYDDDNGLELFFIPNHQVECFTIYER